MIRSLLQEHTQERVAEQIEASQRSTFMNETRCGSRGGRHLDGGRRCGQHFDATRFDRSGLLITFLLASRCQFFPRLAWHAGRRLVWCATVCFRRTFKGLRTQVNNGTVVKHGSTTQVTRALWWFGRSTATLSRERPKGLESCRCCRTHG